MRLMVVLSALGLLCCLSGCVDPGPGGSSHLNPSALAWFTSHGYHTAPYDNTGNGPGVTGLEGGGG